MPPFVLQECIVNGRFSLNFGREKWTIKTKTIKTKIRAPLTQVRALLEALEAPLVARWLAR